jgi:hypothetical protein
VTAAAEPATAQPVAPRPASAGHRLRELMRHRPALGSLFAVIWDYLAALWQPDELESWAAAVLGLVEVNAGARCLIAFLTSSKHHAADGAAPLLRAALAAAEICRHAGAAAATAAIAAEPIARGAWDAAALPQWWRIMAHLARQAPESVEPVAARMAQMLSACSVDGFADFIGAGLKAAASSKTRRLAFFSMQDDLSQRLLARASAGAGFAETEATTRAFVTALWGTPPLLLTLAIDPAQGPQRRSSIAGPLIRLPEFYRGVQGDAARALYKAAAAHAQAHLVFGGPLFPIRTLKPLQVALVGLVEDARVETLAMRRLPGLRGLWSPYHVALPASIATAPALLARLARALFDPACQDDDGFVRKGRALFAAAAARLQDPAISREIGMLLGNELGQMRVQFNARTYAVKPFYRDDGLGLWDFGKHAPTSGEALELTVDAARITHQPDGAHAGRRSEAATDASGRARSVAPDPRGIVIATYPEWDLAHGIARPDWTTVREVPARFADPRLVEDALAGAGMLRGRITRLVRSVRIGRITRRKRQLQGHDLDIDAMLEAGLALRMGIDPDPRIFRSSAATPGDLAVLLLIDVSESTRDRLKSGSSILDVERLAVAVLAEAMATLGDPFCLLAFASNGRDDVWITTVKAFGDAYDRSCAGRLAGLTSGLSTRLGAALRHAGAVIAEVASARKLVIVLTDGEPSDIDVTDPIDLVEDARRAAAGLRASGVDGFGVVLDPTGMGSATKIFGRGNTMLVHRPDDLPDRLSEVYFRLARR